MWLIEAKYENKFML